MIYLVPFEEKIFIANTEDGDKIDDLFNLGKMLQEDKDDAISNLLNRGIES